MINRIRQIIEPGLIPFTLALLFSLFIIFYRLLGLPSPQQLVLTTRELYENYGAIILVVAAFFEAVFMISLYFPGSFIILVAVLISDRSLSALAVIGIYSWLGFMLSMIVNYVMGKYGYYRILLFLGKKNTIQSMKDWMDRYGQWVLLLTAFHPNYLSVSVVCSGISRLSFKTTLFIAGSSLILWIFLWLVFATPVLDQINIEDPNQSWFIVLVFLMWGIVLIFIDNFQKQRQRNN